MDRETYLSKCFVCEIGDLVMSSSLLRIPHFGEVAITTFACGHCGYRSTDIIPVESKPPARYSCEVNGEQTLSIRVIRSSTGTISIPEIGVRIDPGTASDGYITNSEGVLNRVEAIIDQVLRESYTRIEGAPDDGAARDSISRCLWIKDRIMAAKAGIEPLTIVIEDPMGNSALAGEGDIRREDLSPEEIGSLLASVHTDAE